jgi:PAS domain S-box-containing protein
MSSRDRTPASTAPSPVPEGESLLDAPPTPILQDVSSLGPEERYRLLVETMLQGVVHHDATGRIIAMNPAAERILGLSIDAVLGSEPAEHEHHTIREDGTPFPGVEHPSSVALRTGQHQRGVVMGVFNAQSLEYRWISVDAVPVSRPGEVGACEAYTVFEDITESKHAEKALRESQQRLRLATDAAGVGVWQWQPDTDQAIWENDRPYEIFGTPRSEGPISAARFVSEFIHPEDVSIFEQAFSNTLSAGLPLVYEGRFYRTDREMRWVEFKGVRVPATEETPLRILGTVRDITESKRAGELLRQNTGLLSTLVDQAPTGTYVVNSQLRFQQVNGLALPFFERFLPLIGRDFQEIMTALWGPELGRRCAEIFQGILATGETYISPSVSVQRQDIGIEQTFEWEAQRIIMADGSFGVVCYFREVTEKSNAERALRQSEERMRLATEATGVGIWEWNVTTDQIWWDARMFKMYGVPSTADGHVPYTMWSEAVLPEELARQEELLQQTLRKGGQGAREFRIRRRNDGAIRNIQAVETVRADADGKVICVVGTNLDITQRKADEAALGEAARRKDEFIAMLSHELRNPLTAIRNAVRIAGDAAGDAATAQWAGQVVDRQSMQLSRMVDDLLDMARINRGRIELRRVELDLRTVLDHAAAAARPWLSQRSQEFDAEMSDEPLWINGDEARIEQIFVNLLNNAAKYTQEGGRIQLVARRLGSEAVVSVTDNGSGIPPNLLPHIFDLFTQGDTTLDRAQGGLGIGLTVVQSLAVMHGGAASASSAGHGAGSTFTVRLPLIGAPGVKGRAPQAPAPRPRLPASLRILIVDDHDDAASTLGRLLTGRGAHVRVAHDGPEGIGAAAEFQPQVLLLDIGLPGCDGYELARTLRGRPGLEHALFVAVSGYAADADRAKSLQAGFDFHFAKPVDFDALLGVVRSRYPA